MTVHLLDLLLPLSTAWKCPPQMSQQLHLSFSSELVISFCGHFLFSDWIPGGFTTWVHDAKFGNYGCMANNTLSLQTVAALPVETPQLLCLSLLPGETVLVTPSLPLSLLPTNSELSCVSRQQSRKLEEEQKPEMVSFYQVLVGQCSYMLSLIQLVFNVV